jgi:hypothetical protein
MQPIWCMLCGLPAFPDGYFDSVASVSLLEHVSEAGAAIRNGTVTKRDSASLCGRQPIFLAPEPHVR